MLNSIDSNRWTNRSTRVSSYPLQNENQNLLLVSLVHPYSNPSLWIREINNETNRVRIVLRADE